MPVGFGFGVGDFIATINLFKDVAVALKDQGGASDNYQRTLSRLETTSSILSCLEALDNPIGNVATLNAIRGLAHLIRRDVDNFLASIEKYKFKLLRLGGTKKIISSAVAKIKWSQFVVKEVIKLHQEVQIHTTNLDLLLNLHNIQASNSVIHEQGRVRAFQVDMNKVNLKAHTTTLQAIHGSLSEVNMHLGFLDTENSIRNDQIILDMAKKHEELKVLLTNNRQRPNTSQGLMLVLTIPQLNLSPKDITSILRHLSEEVEVIVKIFLASFLIVFKDLLLAIPQMVLLYKVFQCLPAAISLVLHENIAFEDALGRMQSLQFQQFRHWPVFEASLRCKFEQLPGMQKVSSGQYILTSPKHKNQLTAKNWYKVVTPGLVVKMAISIQHIPAEQKRCPRGCKSDTSRLTEQDFSCNECGLVFIVQIQTEHTVMGSCLMRSEPSKSQTSAEEQNDEGADEGPVKRLRDLYLDGGLNERIKQRHREIEELLVFKRVHLHQLGPFEFPWYRSTGMTLISSAERAEDIADALSKFRGSLIDQREELVSVIVELNSLSVALRRIDALIRSKYLWNRILIQEDLDIVLENVEFTLEDIWTQIATIGNGAARLTIIDYQTTWKDIHRSIAQCGRSSLTARLKLYKLSLDELSKIMRRSEKLTIKQHELTP